jgi:hypothetical protein
VGLSMVTIALLNRPPNIYCACRPKTCADGDAAIRPARGPLALEARPLCYIYTISKNVQYVSVEGKTTMFSEVLRA